jgi:hypothetical protein
MNNIQALLDLNTLLLKQNAELKRDLNQLYTHLARLEVERDSLLYHIKRRSNFQGTFEGESPF